MPSLPRFALAVALLTAACGRDGGDPLPAPPARLTGDGLLLAQVNDPAAGLRPEGFPDSPWSVKLAGVVVSAIDTFDETRDGRSVGTVYVQDIGVPGPFTGSGTFGIAFQPSSYKPSVGDVLDVTAQYQENRTIGATVQFPEGTFLPQLFRPTASLRFEGQDPTPVDIDPEELRTFETGRKWIGVLVRVQGLTLPQGLSADARGRVFGPIVEGTDRNLPVLSNEMTELPADAYAPGTTFTSVTGVVTFFYNLRLAPRKAADLVR